MPQPRNFFAHLGIKNTQGRNSVFEVLQRTPLPITAEDIYWQLKEKGKIIHLSTVYRILDLFVSKGIIIRSMSSLKTRSLFEIAKKNHQHHIICLHCKKILAIENCPLKCYEKSLQSKTQYNIIGHKLEIFGYCPECKNILENQK